MSKIVNSNEVSGGDQRISDALAGIERDVAGVGNRLWDLAGGGVWNEVPGGDYQLVFTSSRGFLVARVCVDRATGKAWTTSTVCVPEERMSHVEISHDRTALIYHAVSAPGLPAQAWAIATPIP